MKKTLTLLLLLAGTTCYAQKVKLELNLQKDSTYYLSSSANVTITENIPGQTQVITTVIGGRVSHKVVAVRDTVYEMEARYESISMNLELGGKQVMNVNTQLNAQDIMSKIMQAMLHRPVTIVISKSGKILDIKNTENLYQGIVEGFPEISAEKKAEFKARMQQSFGAKSFKNNFQDAFAVLPAVAVGVNDTWVNTTYMEAVTMARIKTTYKLISAADNVYTIHGDAEVDPTGKADYAQLNGMPMRLNDASGKSTADFTLDKKTGWVLQAKVAKNIKGNVEIKDNPKVPGGAMFPMSIVGDITMTDK